MSQSGLGIKQYLGPKSWLEVWVLGIFGLAKRLLGWISTKESFGQITPTPRSLLAKSPPKTLQAISRSSSLHQGVIWPNHCRSLDLEIGEAGRCIGGIFPTLKNRSRSRIICSKHRQVFVFIGKVTRCVGYHNFRLNGQTLDQTWAIPLFLPDYQ